MTSVRLDHISKNFGRTIALDDIDLGINAGVLFFLLGPSGCGKSTLLRLIAGLHEPSRGRILFNDSDVTSLGTEKRNAVMCFQSYALWPHMTVRDNIKFGLDVRKISAPQQKVRIDEMLELVQMTEFADRRPNQLSGGQQQRVALARALAVRPACLLLDEPLSNLDSKLRLEMRSEIRRICKTSGITTIYVTHDQKEALSVADRIAVMHNGKLAQVGSPSELYHSPANSFVADFIGHTNVLQGKIISRDESLIRVETAAGIVSAQSTAESKSLMNTVTLSIRPEHLRLASANATPAENRFAGKTIDSAFLGEASEHVVQVAGQQLKLVCMPPQFNAPKECILEFDARDVLLMPS